MPTVTTAGLKGILAGARAYLDGLWLRLYVNDYVPSASSTWADLREAEWDGYAPQSLSPWRAVFIDAGEAVTRVQPILFVCNAPGDPPPRVYGYFVTDAEQHVLWAERHPTAPVILAQAGQPYVVAPMLILGPDLSASP